jgi:hydroxymethylglutaryl-CoA reductase
MNSSRISGFYKKSVNERLKIIAKIASLTSQEVRELKKFGSLGLQRADKMIENVIGSIELPLGIATNFIINGKETLIPMAIEEPSIIAAASNAARLCRSTGGFKAESSKPLMIGQIQFVYIKDFVFAENKILENKAKLIEIANKQDKTLVKLGGGAIDLETRKINTKKGKMLVIHLIVDVRDAMGANTVNTMCEKIAPKIQELIGGEFRLRIISNYAIKRMVKAKAEWLEKEIGSETINQILEAFALAEADEFRAVTHNKGIMNGIDAVAIATGNDFRAIEAGAHSFAARNGKYGPLTKWFKNSEGNLVGEIELPLAVGIVGGATKTNPIAKIALKILKINSAQELAETMACVGLANNFAAMRAIVVEGIQKGHMKLHSRNIAIIAGAQKKEIDIVAEKIVKEGKISVDFAREVLKKLRKEKK